jgi:alkylation response protein AidB-like acyl-CoA dehydrogenase
VALSFVDCRLPDSARLGQEGQGFEIAMTALDGGRCGIGGQALGMGYRVLAESARHLEARKIAEKAVGTEQNSQFRLADMAMRLDAAWLMVLRAAWLRDQGKKMSREAAMAKVMATEAGDFAAKTAMQLVGAAALDARHPVARALRDVRVSRIYEGTSEIQRLVIARSLAASV